MEQHSIFYYPYASFGAQQSPLFKATELYFDKLVTLNPIDFPWEIFGDMEKGARAQ